MVYRYAATDAGMRNMAAVTLPELGFTGRAVQRDRPHPGRRLFGSATSRTRAHHATPADPDREEHQPGNSRPTATTGRRCQRAAPHRTNDVDTDQRRRTLDSLPGPHPLTTAAIEGSQERTLPRHGMRQMRAFGE